MAYPRLPSPAPSLRRFLALGAAAALPADPDVGIRSATPTDRIQVLRPWFDRNTRP